MAVKQVFELDTEEALAKVKATPYVLKEGSQYRMRVRFRVQVEIVSGLKMVNRVYKKGIPVDKGQNMLGSFGPRKESHVAMLPLDVVPSGMLARGSYKGKARFVDDDGKDHVQWEYSFTIGKDWA